jgi:hypothetical protein
MPKLDSEGYIVHELATMKVVGWFDLKAAAKLEGLMLYFMKRQIYGDYAARVNSMKDKHENATTKRSPVHDR